MNRFLRIILLVIGAVSLALTIGLFIQAGWATAIWPLPAGRLSCIFLSSIIAAAGTPVVWIALVGENRAQAGGALNLGLVNAGSAVFSLQLYLRDHTPQLLTFSIVTAILAIGCAAIYFYSRRYSFLDLRPTPLLVRISFGIFAPLLALTGGALVLKRPNIFPWPLTPETSVFYGWIFLGAMCYFVYGLIYPCWSNAKGQLLGFLAYDVVLIVPFLLHFQTVLPELRLSLTVYTSVLIISGAVAVYFLFIYRKTRFHFTRQEKVRQTASF